MGLPCTTAAIRASTKDSSGDCGKRRKNRKDYKEAMEAYRDGNPESEKIPPFSKMEEDLVDVIIRLLDFAGGTGLDIEGALAAKMAYNESRPYRHGGKAA